MLDKKQNTKQLIIGFILIALLIYCAWVTVSFFINSLVEADAKIASTIIAGMFTIFAGLTAVIITQRQTKLRDIAEAHREKKIEIYNKFITAATTMIGAQNEYSDIKSLTDKELFSIMFNFKKDILLWGSPEVIKAQLKLERVTQENSNLILFAVNDIYKAMRKDIGLSNSGLGNNELIKLFMIDSEEMDNALKSSNKTQEEEQV